MRAILIVTADGESLASAMESGAHALIVDVSGGAVPPRLAGRPADAPLLYLRSTELERDLPAMMAIAPHGIVLPRCEGARDVARLGSLLAVEEALNGWADGATRILALIETARGAFGLQNPAGSSRRLAGIVWDAEALRAEIGAPALRDRDGILIPPLAQVRSLVRLAAAASGVEAIDSACESGGDLAGDTRQARRDGFSAKLALSPDQARAIALA